ncbi:MAG: iron-sulfur cluster assembly protein [Bacteroidales bacterium]|jgi:FeS assembly SUF system protein
MEEQNKYLELESEIGLVLKNIYDPEIPVNIYDLGLIYEIIVEEGGKVEVVMTLTAPNCPMVDELMAEINEKVRAVEGVNDLVINLTFDPPWEKSMMTEEAMLDLGLL